MVKLFHKKKNTKNKHASRKGSNAKRALRNIYFSRPSDKKNLSDEQYDKDLERKIEKLDEDTKKHGPEFSKGPITVAGLEKSLVLMNKIVEELREENESLRKERQFFLNAVKKILLSREETYFDTTNVKEKTEEKEEDSEKPVIKTYTDQQSVRQIRTSLDALLEMIMKKGSVKINEASKKLRVNDKKIEEWAQLLEEHGLIDIHYPTVGKPVLKKKAKVK